MKKSVVLFALLLFFGLSAQAETYYVESNVNMVNFWEKNGKEQQKITEVATRIIRANKLDKVIGVVMDKTPKTINAYASFSNKTVHISQGLLPYMDSDDELAAVLSHEMAHILDFYKGWLSWATMKFNSRQYEFRADTVGIDLMVNAGYNPIAMINTDMRWMGENYWDIGIFASHPKTSRRVMAQYKYIYQKYPQFLQTEMTKNIAFQNFLTVKSREIAQFKQKEKSKEMKRNNLL